MDQVVALSQALAAHDRLVLERIARVCLAVAAVAMSLPLLLLLPLVAAGGQSWAVVSAVVVGLLIHVFLVLTQRRRLTRIRYLQWIRPPFTPPAAAARGPRPRVR